LEVDQSYLHVTVAQLESVLLEFPVRVSRLKLSGDPRRRERQVHDHRAAQPMKSQPNVPSLRGVWYRGMFSHDGSVTTLEEWCAPERLRDDFVPSGFKGYNVARRAVPGHPFGLALSVEDKAALIAFLKSL
jgi:hypothetical protein